MELRLKFCGIAVAAALVLGAAQVALAQVGPWTTVGLCVEPGDPGEWDPTGHVMGDVVFDGTHYHMYLVGGEGSSLDDPWRVGHWVSADKLSWIPDPANPVLRPEPGQWDGFSIIDLAVHYDGAMFHMWYGASETYHGLVHGGYATNANGWGEWDKYPGNPLDGLGPGDPGSWDERGPAPGTVLVDGGTYSMWYTAAQDDPWGTWRIGYATSPDGLAWTPHPDPVLEGSEPWEGIRVFYPEAVPSGAGHAMWYSGVIEGPVAKIGYAVSPDGVAWGRWPANPVIQPVDPCHAASSIAVIIEGDTVHAWIDHCAYIWYLTAPLEQVFFDAFETGDTSIWNAVVP